MIRNDSEYKEAVEDLERMAVRVEQYEAELKAQGLSPDEVFHYMGLMLGQRDRLESDIRRYDRIKRGDLSEFDAIRDLGLLLVAARIASGVSQRDLSKKLQVHESQVSRDERDEYQGVSIERAARILEALDVDLRIEARCKVSSALLQHYDPVPPSEMRLPAQDRWKFEWEEPVRAASPEYDRHCRRAG